jgi:hypothetical protein
MDTHVYMSMSNNMSIVRDVFSAIIDLCTIYLAIVFIWNKKKRKSVSCDHVHFYNCHVHSTLLLDRLIMWGQEGCLECKTQVHWSTYEYIRVFSCANISIRIEILWMNRIQENHVRLDLRRTCPNHWSNIENFYRLWLVRTFIRLSHHQHFIDVPIERIRLHTKVHFEQEIWIIYCWSNENDFARQSCSKLCLIYIRIRECIPKKTLVIQQTM